MSESEISETAKKAIEFREGHRVFQCPHCSGKIKVGLEIQVNGLTIHETTNRNWKDGLQTSQIELIERAESCGLIAAFEQALKNSTTNIPKEIRTFFLGFMAKATPKMLPSFAMQYYIKEFNNKRITAFGANGIIAILADGYIKTFVPKMLVSAVPLKRPNGSTSNASIPPDQGKFVEWTRTRFGYVVGKGEMFDSLRKRTFGEFAKPGF